MTAILELRSITARYGRSTVLHDVDLAVAPGEVLALLGPNGAGKTTLLRVAAGLLAPADGAVLVGGEPATGWPRIGARGPVCASSPRDAASTRC